ncbi:hypothetical protein [Streptomyces poonensis]|uniref:Uncharacterized protein n=1 Tax=Streptomyces poonensis TaxID=68255 RepID=A0A918PCD6_9ACTN|nr:hypothetical protein [Streptomyces poonensis]GGY97835.1 hypothetical protein GCM10010365_15450 [Streptomyces poonensis]
MSDGIEWIHEALNGWGFQLVALKDAGVEELAVMLGAEPGTVMAAPAFNALVAAAGSTVRLPDLARLGTCGGWAFAFETGGGVFRLDRDHLSHLWEGRTYVRVSDTMMDPPTLHAVVDGAWDWRYFDGVVHEQVRADHPLTARMTAEIGLGGAVPDPDFPDDPDEWALYVPAMADVYRLFGEHYGLTLPRLAIGEPYHYGNTELYGVFTAPRTLPDGRPNPKYESVPRP